jgi:hypothetical protein
MTAMLRTITGDSTACITYHVFTSTITSTSVLKELIKKIQEGFWQEVCERNKDYHFNNILFKSKKI